MWPPLKRPSVTWLKLRCLASTSISAARSVGAQLAPPAVPRLRSGSLPSNSQAAPT
jgi:hypothetical protein